jgi:hypothetical protein
METTTQTQRSVILADLQKGNELTPKEALKWFDCFRLAARINELRKEGWPIITERRDIGDGRHVAVYSMTTDRTQWPQ